MGDRTFLYPIKVAITAKGEVMSLLVRLVQQVGFDEARRFEFTYLAIN